MLPSAPNSNGRFRFIPSKNAFMLVNRAYEDVYIYKRTL